MPLKKKQFKEGEIAIFDDAVIYKRGEYWQFRMWLTKEGKYARFSLKTRSQSTAEDKAKLHYHELMAGQLAGRTYFSLTTKIGVERYLEKRKEDVVAKRIVPGRYTTISTHLKHWLDYIGRDTKLKELEITDCEDYFNKRNKYKKETSISVTTVANEQSTINALMKWLFKRNETHIDGFDFDKLPRIDRKNDKVRRSTFSPTEMDDIVEATKQYCDIEENKLDENEYKQRQLACYYFLIASVTGLRSGEQRQLKWSDIYWTEAEKEKTRVPLVHITVRAETSKVRTTREFLVADNQYFKKLRQLLVKYCENTPRKGWLVFSFNGQTPITQRSLLYHFGKLIKLAEIENREQRDIVPYSFRHYFITKKIMSGLSTQFVAEMCGTSPNQIQQTYFHLNEAIKRTSALADYEFDEDGLIVTN